MSKFVLTPELFNALKSDGQDDKGPAFLAIYEGCRDSIYIFSYNMLRNEEEAEDITMKTFFTLWTEINQFHEPAHLRNYLFLVARNACLNTLKHNHRRETLYEKYQIAEMGETGTPEQFMERERIHADLLANVYQAIRHLPEKTRDVIILRYYSGKSAMEVAGIMGISIKAVYNQTQQALKVLRGRLMPGSLELILLLLVSQVIVPWLLYIR